MTIGVLDYGAGNLTSVVKGLTHVGAHARVLAIHPFMHPSVHALVIPGVGNFHATAAIGPEWRAAIRDRIDAGMPVLGICLGLQWLFEGSAEAPDLPGLGVFAGRCFRLHGDVKVPHVGWNTLERTAQPSRLLAGVPDGASAYFTHAYAAPLDAAAVATTSHGQTFTSCIERGSVFGTQCHPEKSHDVGLRLLANFAAMAGTEG